MTIRSSQKGSAAVVILIIIGVLVLIVIAVIIIGIIAFSKVSSTPKFKQALQKAQQDQMAKMSGQTTPLDESGLEVTPYLNNQTSFKIKPPKSWTKNESGISGTLVIFLNPQVDYEGANTFDANINVITQPSQGLTLAQVGQVTSAQLSQVLTNYVQTEKRSVTAGGNDGYIFGGTFTQGAFKIQNKQLVIVRGDKIYIVTASALQSKWTNYNDLFEKSLLSFSL